MPNETYHEVFQLPEEDTHEGIPVDILQASSFQENAGLVQQQDGSPRMTNVQYLGQLCLEEPRVRAQFTCRD